MSTRAHVRVFGHIKGQPVELSYYHHSDGYPQYLGNDLKGRLAASEGNLERFAELLTEERYYDKDEGIHGDEAYLYIVDYDNGKVTCYNYSWDETLLETLQSNIIIPEEQWNKTDRNASIRYAQVIRCARSMNLKNTKQMTKETSRHIAPPSANTTVASTGSTAPNVILFKRITEEMAQTYERKNQDYGNSFGQSVAEHGAIAGIVRIGDKYNRAKQLLVQKTPAAVNGESARDTLLDLANYAIMLAMEIEDDNFENVK